MESGGSGEAGTEAQSGEAQGDPGEEIETGGGQRQETGQVQQET